MKLSLSLLAFLTLALSLCACNTLANRRSLYAPKKGDGYWTRTLDDGTWRARGTKPADATIKRGNSRPSNPAPAVPPPAPEPLPDAAGGAQQPGL